MDHIADELRERTFRFALSTIRFCRALPDTWVEREIGRQLLRAGMGVAGNYWSACRGRSGNEFIAKIGVAADEADESVLWLTAIVQSDLTTGTDAKVLLAEGREIRAILSKSHKTAKENRRKRRNEAKLAKQQLAKSPTRQFSNSI